MAAGSGADIGVEFWLWPSTELNRNINEHRYLAAALAARRHIVKSAFRDACHRTPGRFCHLCGVATGSERVMKTIFVVMVLAFAFATGMAVTTIIAQTVS